MVSVPQAVSCHKRHHQVCGKEDKRRVRPCQDKIRAHNVWCDYVLWGEPASVGRNEVKGSFLRQAHRIVRVTPPPSADCVWRHLAVNGSGRMMMRPYVRPPGELRPAMAIPPSECV
jgi:hypothetical protein